MAFKPLLAEIAQDFTFPAYASIKIDGIRGCVMPELGLVSRKIKPIPNTYIRSILSANALWHHDGEILTYTNGKMDDFNTVQSRVMRESGAPDFQYWMFDHFQYPDKPYNERMCFIKPGLMFTKVVTQFLVQNMAELIELEKKALDDGYEGLIVRSLNGRYKYGRSTVREGILLKFVRKFRAEAVVTGSYEREENTNEATINELGYTKRSSHKDGKIGRGDLGGLNLLWDGMVSGSLFPGVVIPEGGAIAFDCGTGFDDKMRSRLWGVRETLPGKIGTFEFRGIGSNMRPRFPTWIGFRED